MSVESDSRLAAEDMAGMQRISKAAKWHIEKDWQEREAVREQLIPALESGSKVIVSKVLLDAVVVGLAKAQANCNWHDCGPKCHEDLEEAVRQLAAVGRPLEGGA